ncbi:MAG: aldo/keto reductase [Verrucomicrobia bacterium]|nr:aldo/keto reductase [Verrucomicrobiota bacterium]
MSYQPASTRYDNPAFYRACGNSGLKLPLLSLGLWHNFGASDDYANSRAMILRAFDLGITHLDLANNYGTPAGSAETTCGRVLREDLAAHRDELIISTKAGYDMWPGPYGEWGSRKYVLASLDQSLRRLGLPYVDIFYSHRPDPNTPLEETMGALDYAVRSGKALYAGLSNYDPEQTSRAAAILRRLGTPCLIHQPRYNMLERTAEQGLFDVLRREGIGSIVFSPLAKGMLTNRYFAGLPKDARAARDPRFLTPDQITHELLVKTKKLDTIARDRSQTLAQMALAWVLRQPAVTTALIGASKTSQIDDNVGAIKNLNFSEAELFAIDQVLAS